MITNVETTTYEEALRRAMEAGFNCLWDHAEDHSLKELLEDAAKHPSQYSGDDWIIIGEFLCKTGEAWQPTNHVYQLDVRF